jgi:hypothetical protein
MVWEWNWPTYWGIRDSLNFFWVTFNAQFSGNHSPGFHFELGILNLVLLDFGYYNMYHEDDE